MRLRAGRRAAVVGLAAVLAAAASAACAERSDRVDGDDLVGGAERDRAATTAPPGPDDGLAAEAVGAAGVGDPYFPDAGNGGYDVARYVLDLAWTPGSDGSGRIEGTTRVEATATQPLARFHLDLAGLDVAEVTVDGEPATVAREGERELVITPATPIDDGRSEEHTSEL